jgi:GT2 family glycosyltransferase
MISVIVCSNDPAKFSRVEQHFRQLLGTEPYELIDIHDARSLSEGYNRGIARAKGDVLIFSHDDIEFIAPQGWLDRFKNHLSHFDVIGLAGTKKLMYAMWIYAGPPHIFGQVAHTAGTQDWPEQYKLEIFSAPAPAVPDIQALDGMFIAVRRDVLASAAFDEKNFDGFHCYDLDFTFCAYLAGFKLAVACDLPVIHGSIGNLSEQWHRAARQFMLKHHMRLAPVKKRRFAITCLAVETKEDLREIMLPPQVLQEFS